MSESIKNITQIISTLPETVQLVAVSKTYPAESIAELYDAGYRVFGENRPQELKEKYALLPKDIEWHMIGHLQKNKVKYIAPFVRLIHSVDSLELLKVIEKEAKKNNRIISCLLEIKIAQEDAKHGMSYEEVSALLNDETYLSMQYIRIDGIMGMATYTSDTAIVKKEFQTLKNYFEQLKAEYFSTIETFKEISMGMSGDYQYAVESGSTMVRIGSRIFGKR